MPPRKEPTVAQSVAHLGEVPDHTCPGTRLAAAGQRNQSGDARFPSQLGDVISGDRAGDQG
jgi:hypothetical protein